MKTEGLNIMSLNTDGVGWIQSILFRIRSRSLVLMLMAVSSVFLIILVLKMDQNLSYTTQERVISRSYEWKRYPKIVSAQRKLRKIHEQRRRQIQRVCNSNGAHGSSTSFLSPSRFSNLYVDDKHGLLYCEVPKVACTNWKRILLILGGHVNTTNPLELPSNDVHHNMGDKLKTLDTYSLPEMRFRLDNYFKFMFVRDPLERLLSAFRNKFNNSQNQYFTSRFGVKIVKRYRKNPTERALRHGDDITFREFVKYLIDTDPTKTTYNDHWRHYYKLCHPCLVKYDAIGKYETFHEDIDFILREVGVAHKITFPYGAGYTTRTSTFVKQEYSKLSSEELHKLWQLYAVDFSMFGYKYPDINTADPDYKS